MLTPAKQKDDTKQGRWDSDDEFDDDDDNAFGSPPKTMQFHVPQSRLLKTPGKQKSLSRPIARSIARSICSFNLLVQYL